MLLRVSFAVLFVQDFLQRQGVAVMASSFSAAASGNAAEEEASFLAALFRECWGKCYEQLLEEKTSLFELFDPAFSASNHSAHCRRYRTARRCASSCVPGEHARFLQPFYDRNRVNELVCIDQPGEFSRHQSCLSGASAGGHSMRFFFAKCAVPLAGAGTGSAAVAGGIPSGAGAGASALLRPTRETCTSIQCALRYVPEIMRENCEQHSASPAAAREAAVLLSNIIEGWLRERIVAYDRLLKSCGEHLRTATPSAQPPVVANED